MRAIISAGVLALVFLWAPAMAGQNPSTAPARTYYFDSAAGKDSNTGTAPASAWKTLAKVNATTFLPGDRILLKSGSVWQGQLWPKGSGAEGRPIIIDMYGGGVKTIGNGTRPILSASCRGFRLRPISRPSHRPGRGLARLHVELGAAEAVP